MSALEIRGLGASYGTRRALLGVDLDVEDGDSVAILGPNGAGKSTTLRCVAGLHRPVEGRIVFGGEDIGRLPAHAIARLGIAMVPEGRHLFTDHTVLENLELGAYQLLRGGQRAAYRQSLDDVCRLFPFIASRMAQRAGSLSGGEQQMVAIARALVSRPKLLLLDEPSLGLGPIPAREMSRALVALRMRGMTILIAEQLVRPGLQSSNRAVVLRHGRVALSGTSARLVSDPRVADAYLGVSGPAPDPGIIDSGV